MNTPAAMKSWNVKWPPIARPSIVTLEMYVGPASENDTYASACLVRITLNLKTGNTDSVRNRSFACWLLHSE